MGREGSGRVGAGLVVAAAVGVASLAPAAAPPPTFTDVTVEAGVYYEHGWIDPTFGVGSRRPSPVNTSGVAAGDYDRDGDVDLYAVRGDIGPNLLFRNRGDGTFEDVTAASGITSNRDSVSAAFGDYDRDGDLDLFITHWGDNSPPGPTQQLWRNDGTGAFTDVSAAAGISASYAMPDGQIADLSFTPSFADVDNDGWPDLLVAGDFRTSQVFRNNRNGTFTNTTDPAVITDENAMGLAVGDYDDDGNLDWFVSSIWDPDQDAMGNNWFVSGNRLYRGHGDGTFSDVTDVAGVREGYWGWGATFADFDNDGDLDLYHTNGWKRDDPAAHEFHFDPARAWLSNGGGSSPSGARRWGSTTRCRGAGWWRSTTIATATSTSSSPATRGRRASTATTAATRRAGSGSS